MAEAQAMQEEVWLHGMGARDGCTVCTESLMPGLS